MPERKVVPELLAGVLPPRAYHLGRYIRWQVRFCLPRAAAGRFVRPAPPVQSFPAGQPSPLADELRQVNTLLPTEFCRVMTWHGSDKGKGHSFHNYTTVYSALFGKLRNEPVRIFELGLGPRDPKAGEMGMPGASLRGWRDLFPRASIFGADIEKDVLFESPRIRTFYCDQLDAEVIRDLWAQPGMAGGMDIIIDDGLHTFEANISFMKGSLSQLRPGGYYVVEDIEAQTIPEWVEYLKTAAEKDLRGHEIALVPLPARANIFHNNNLLILRRTA